MKHFVSPIAVALLLASAAVQAHSHLESSKPAEGSTISATPPNIELNFSQAVRITALSIQKGDEKKQTLGPLPDKPAQEISVAVPALSPGKYTVSYRAMSADNHVMAGTLTFTVSASQTADHGTMDHSQMSQDKMSPGKMNSSKTTDQH